MTVHLSVAGPAGRPRSGAGAGAAHEQVCRPDSGAFTLANPGLGGNPGQFATPAGTAAPGRGAAIDSVPALV